MEYCCVKGWYSHCGNRLGIQRVVVWRFWVHVKPEPVNAYFLTRWFSPFFRRREPWWRLNWVDEYLANFQSGRPQTRQTSVIHLLRIHRAALLLLELFTMNVLLQAQATIVATPIWSGSCSSRLDIFDCASISSHRGTPGALMYVLDPIWCSLIVLAAGVASTIKWVLLKAASNSFTISISFFPVFYLLAALPSRLF